MRIFVVALLAVALGYSITGLSVLYALNHGFGCAFEIGPLSCLCVGFLARLFTANKCPSASRPTDPRPSPPPSSAGRGPIVPSTTGAPGETECVCRSSADPRYASGVCSRDFTSRRDMFITS